MSTALLEAPAAAAVERDYVAAFWARVDKSDPDACWVWTGPPDEHGYGRATYGPGLVDLAHRVSWRFEYGEIPDGVCILHHCDHRPCVRPIHLFAGDRGDNARDMAAKGRQFLQRHPERALRGDEHWSRRRPERVSRGERCGKTRLTTDQVVRIRLRHAVGESLNRLAFAFQVSRTAIASVVTGRTWAHAGGPTRPIDPRFGPKRARGGTT